MTVKVLVKAGIEVKNGMVKKSDVEAATRILAEEKVEILLSDWNSVQKLYKISMLDFQKFVKMAKDTPEVTNEFGYTTLSSNEAWDFFFEKAKMTKYDTDDEGDYFIDYMNVHECVNELPFYAETDLEQHRKNL